MEGLSGTLPWPYFLNPRGIFIYNISERAKLFRLKNKNAVTVSYRNVMRITECFIKALALTVHNYYAKLLVFL